MMINKTQYAGKTYATNGSDEGLFVWTGENWKQIEGTCDFNVRDVKDKAAKIKRYLKKRYGDR